MKPNELVKEICSILLEKKAQDIVKIDISEKTVIADYFVIASGSSSTQVKSLCDNLDEKLEKQGVFVKRSDGVKEGRWAVLDFGDVIVHVFNDETRLFYHLEKLWSEGTKIEKIED